MGKDTSIIVVSINLNQLRICQTVSIYVLGELVASIEELSLSISDLFVINFQMRFKALINRAKYVFLHFRPCSTT